MSSPTPTSIDAAWARAQGLAVAAGVPADVVARVALTVGAGDRSFAGGHAVTLGRMVRPSYQLVGEDLLEVLLHELGHCCLHAGVRYAASPRGPLAPIASDPERFEAASAGWSEPWERTGAARLAAHLTRSGELPAPATTDLYAAWYASAAAHPLLAAAYQEIAPVTPYGATCAEEDFAEAFVLWCAARDRMPEQSRSRMTRWVATATGGALRGGACCPGRRGENMTAETLTMSHTWACLPRWAGEAPPLEDYFLHGVSELSDGTLFRLTGAGGGSP